jgi:hypothetical protein
MWSVCKKNSSWITEINMILSENFCWAVEQFRLVIIVSGIFKLEKVRTAHGCCDRTKQDRQCTYNVTLRCIPGSLLPWKSNKYYILVWVYLHICMRVGTCMSVCVCSLAYLVCNLYAPYCDVICDLWLHHIFRHDVRKKVTECKMCVLIFCTTFI